MALVDQDGSYLFANVPPGEYMLFAWNFIDDNAYYSTNFLRRYSDRGIIVRIEPDGEPA